jgi:Icc-related predicted phosphoesterase
MTATTYWIGIGDIHDDLAALDRLAALPGLSGAAGILVSGDLTIRGDAPQARLVLEALRRSGPVILAQIGNMDKAGVDAYLTGEGVNIHASGRITPQGVGIFGVGWSTPTPFGTPSEASEERVAAWLAKAHAAVAGCSKLLLVCHTPPHGTATDVVGAGVHVGSTAVREFIERVQPDVCLTGHIHEARAEDVIGRTRIVNPGALSGGGYARIEYDGEHLTATLASL